MELQVAIVNSQTLEEVARLEKILKLVIMMPRPTLKQPKKTTVTDEENEANDGPSDAEPEQKNESADMEQISHYFGFISSVQSQTIPPNCCFNANQVTTILDIIIWAMVKTSIGTLG
ncbi:uncharacterized protein LOC114266139 isoform X1 [Camellia sinensis]|uniref:uncharacterized protein LOC114266139 isoform X1 n=1 Tax=Camellia sinensis TaxID=4442 RepID=UPI0010365D28|nr:uncharacterized protein LOC114266139 isoform X1 [Camellia sinensis]